MSKLIFDIGSNALKFSEACMERYEDCRIIAVDVMEEFKPRTPTHLKQITWVNKAVSDVEGSFKDVYVNVMEPGMTTVSEYYAHNSRFSLGNEHILKNYHSHSKITNDGGKTCETIDYDLFKSLIVAQNGSIEAFLKGVLKQERQMRKVESTTLDSLIESYGVPELIKIDVEGYEHVVLRGLSQRVGKICFEWCEEMAEQFYESLSILEKLGYKQFGISGYFAEGDVYSNFTYEPGGEIFLKEPESYHSLAEIKNILDTSLNPLRRISWGMCWVKDAP